LEFKGRPSLVIPVNKNWGVDLCPLRKRGGGGKVKKKDGTR